MSPYNASALPVFMLQASSWYAGPGQVPQAARLSIYIHLFLQRTEFEDTFRNLVIQIGGIQQQAFPLGRLPPRPLLESQGGK